VSFFVIGTIPATAHRDAQGLVLSGRNAFNGAIPYGLARDIVHSPTITASPVRRFVVVIDNFGHFTNDQDVTNTIRRAVELVENPVCEKLSVFVAVYFALHGAILFGVRRYTIAPAWMLV
jgi:hypothetical protein